MTCGAGAEPEVLVVDDDPGLRAALERALRLEGFAVRTAAGGKEALSALVERAAPNVVVLDLTMPDLDGVSVIRHARAHGVDVPICVLSARTEVDDRVAGLRAGADDYLIKPFDVGELVARLHALLRRRPEATGRPLRVGDVLLDAARRRAWRGERDLELTNREWTLLAVLARNRGIVLNRDRLLELVWGYDFVADTNVVDVFVGYLRRKLEAGGESRILHTRRGVGFVLDPDDPAR